MVNTEQNTSEQAGRQQRRALALVEQWQWELRNQQISKRQNINIKSLCRLGTAVATALLKESRIS